MSQIKRILLADDDDDDRFLFNEAVSDLDHHVELSVAPNGETLMSLLNDAPELPDMIFLDLNMPVKDGYECLKEIREEEDYKDIPIVIFSTSCSDKSLNTCYTSGANLYAQKPANLQELRRIVKHCLNGFDFRPQPENFLLKI